MSGTSSGQAEADRLIARAKVVKERAKDLRDDGQFARAIDLLEQMVEELSKWPVATKGTEPASETERGVASQLADCLGMLGGNYRRVDKLPEAQAAFDRGRDYEESPRLTLASSYNLVNAITLPLETTEATPADMAAQLRSAIGVIEQQVRDQRRRDRWAWADLAECQVLLGDDLELALRHYDRALALGDDQTAASIIGVLRRLKGALEHRDPSVPDATKRIGEAIRHLGGD